MERTGKGQYQHHRFRVPNPVEHVDTTKLQKINTSSYSEVSDPKSNSPPPLRLTRSQGWSLALFLATLAGTVFHIGYTALHREYRIEELEGDIREIQLQIDALHNMQLLIERKNVQQDTRLDNLDDQ